MAKANPKAWFTSPIAKISYRSVDKWAKYNERFRPFFPTWGEAHGWMLERATDRLKKAEREIVSAQRSLAKIKAMQQPQGAGGAAAAVPAAPAVETFSDTSTPPPFDPPPATDLNLDKRGPQ